MKDIEQAHSLLKLAEMDLKALKGMLDVETFSDPIFGFHAQQASEKALKAWLAALGREYPLTHNLGCVAGRSGLRRGQLLGACRIQLFRCAVPVRNCRHGR